ncbi:MAG: hypothetical protein KGY41_10710, partial [Desulfovermiculus sp.]|nr:hypothetical protein [Desulfovermiculus sp.]
MSILWGLGSVPCLAADFANTKEHRLAYEAQQKLEQEDYQACIQLLKPHLNKRERPAASLFVLYAQALKEMGQEMEAVHIYARAAELYPQDGLIQRNYAVSNLQAGRLAQAARLFERAFEQDGSKELLHQAGAAWFEAKEYEHAARIMQHLVGKTKKPKEAWVELLVYSLVQAHKWTEAENRLQSLLNHRPNSSKL